MGFAREWPHVLYILRVRLAFMEAAGDEERHVSVRSLYRPWIFRTLDWSWYSIVYGQHSVETFILCCAIRT